MLHAVTVFSSRNRPHNPVVSLRDTSTKIDNSADATNFITDFYNDQGNVPKLKNPGDRLA